MLFALSDWCKSSLYGKHPNQPELNTQVGGNAPLRCSPEQEKALLSWLTVTHPAKIMKFPDVCHYLEMQSQAKIPLHLHTPEVSGCYSNLPQAHLLGNLPHFHPTVITFLGVLMPSSVPGDQRSFL